MADNTNKPEPGEKTREQEIKEWNEAQSSSMLKGTGTGNKRSGILIGVAAVAACGLVYWVQHSGSSSAKAGTDSEISISEPRKVMDPAPRKPVRVAPVSNDGAQTRADTPRDVVNRQAAPQGLSEDEKRRQQIELQRQLEHEKMLAARQRSAIFASAKDDGPANGEAGSAGGSGGSGSGLASLGGGNSGASAPVNANDAYAASTFSDGVPVSKARVMTNLEYKVLQGTTIDAVLQPRAKSDLPGQVCVSVQRDVYAAEGRRVMIPWGSTVCGSYNASLKPGQERLFTIWNWLRTPRLSGRPPMEIAINSGGSDQLGSAGQGGVVDNHWATIFGVAAAVSIIGAGASNGGVSSSDQENSSSNYRTEVQQAAASSSQTILGRYANIQPTLTVPHGSRVVIYLQRDLDFSDQYKDEIQHAQNNGVTYIQ
ncbi:TrbI/VirB10 family protein [Pseudomonas gingeri]